VYLRRPLCSLQHALMRIQASAGHSWDCPDDGRALETITMADGSTESLRCKSANVVNANGRAIQQSLRCASDSYRLEISSNVVSNGGALSGSWAESTRGVSGNISGRASGSAIIANVGGSGFTASLDVRTKGDKQSVTIRPRSGTDVARVSVVLHKS
jgi:hypothetical protein